LCTLEELLLQLGLGNLALDGLVDLLLVSALVVGIVLDGGGEQGVDEGSLSQSRLASNLDKTVRRSFTIALDGDADHNSECGASLRNNLVPLVRQIGNANR